jgi:hypothetical protein
LDGLPVGGGRPGPLFERMHLAFLNYTKDLAGTAAL